MTKTALVSIIAELIATDSNLNDDKNLAVLFNNPGLLRWWPETKIGTSALGEQYAFFKTPDLGWKALKLQISTAIQRNLSMQEFIGGVRDHNEILVPGKYVGFRPELRNPDDYARSICRRLGALLNQSLDIELRFKSYLHG